MQAISKNTPLSFTPLTATQFTDKKAKRLARNFIVYKISIIYYLFFSD